MGRRFTSHKLLLLASFAPLFVTPAFGQVVVPAAPAGAAAPPAESDGLAEIVVTAQKREQSLQQVGISVTAVTGEKIREQNISSSAELASHIVGLENFSPYGPGTSANVVIRGIGLNDFGEGHEAPVTTYIDEFYILSVPAVDFALFDLDRVEVLRGPQGTLFGRNSTGGLVNYVTKHPTTKDQSGYFQISYGKFNDLKVEGAASASLTDHLSVRLSGMRRESDGYQVNLYPNMPRGGAAGTTAFRGQLRYQDDDGWDVLLKGEYGRTSMVQSYYETITGGIDPNTGLVVTNPNRVDATGYAERNTAAAGKNVVNTDGETYLRSRGYNGLLRVEKKFGDTTFSSITGYQSFGRQLSEDSDGTPNPLIVALFPYQGQEMTQELRLYHQGPNLRWTGGVYALRAIGHNQPSATYNYPTSGPGAVNSATGLYNGVYLPIALAADWRLRTNSGAIFGQVEKDLGDFTLSGGVRVTRDAKRFADYDNATFRKCSDGTVGGCFLESQGGIGTAQPFTLDYKKTLVSGKVQVDYKPNHRTLVYASLSRGTKAGGFNNGFYPGGISVSQVPYGAEAIYTYELGEKLTLLDRHLRINSSVFYNDYHDYQTFNFRGIAGLLSNQNASSYGAETEIEAAVARRLSMRLAGAYLETNIKNVSKATPSGGTATADRPMAFAPKWSASGGVTYTLPLTGERAIAFDWNFEARTLRYSGNFGDPGTRLEGFFKHNASVVYNAAENLSFKAFVDNIGNRLNTTYGGPSFADVGIIQVRYAMPRTFGGAATIKW